MSDVTEKEEGKEKEVNRRDFAVNTAIAVGAVGAVAAGVPFVSSLNPDKGVLAAGTTEVDISNVKEGDTLTVMWRGTPVFVKHRTKEEIEIARNTNLEDLIDPEKDEDRVLKGHDKWLVTLAVCTHLGCVPLSKKGDYNGWFCPCHGSHYDTSARIRKGPAPKNLPVPPYKFISENVLLIGEEA